MQSSSNNKIIQPLMTDRHQKLYNIGIELGYSFQNEGICLGVAEAGKLAALDDWDAFRYFTELLDFIQNTPHFSFRLKEVKESIAKRSQESKTLILSEEEQHFLAAHALFDYIALSSNPSVHEELLGERISQIQSFTKVPNYLESHKLKEKGGAVIVDAFSGIYDAKESKNFGALLMEIANGSECNFTVSINHINHAISVYYNKEKDMWFLIDANKLELLEKKENHLVPIKKEQLGKIIFSTSLEPGSEIQAFHTQIFVAEKDREKIASTYKESQIYISLQEVTEKRAQSKTQSGVTLAHHAARFSDLNTLVKIHKISPSAINQKNNEGFTPLHLAIFANSEESTSLLLEKKADLFLETEKNLTSIHILSQNNNVDLMKKIIQQMQFEIKPGIILNRKTHIDGNTPLHTAIKHGSLDFIQFLLDQKAINLTLKNQDNLLPIETIFLHHKNSIEVLNLFISKEGNGIFSKKFSNGMTLAHLAGVCGRLDFLNHLLTKYPNKIGLNDLDETGNTPLHLAVKAGHLNIIHALKDAKVDLTQYNHEGLAPIHCAAKAGDWSACKMLADSGGLSRTQDGSFFFHVAAKFGETQFLSDFFDSRDQDKVKNILALPNKGGQTLADVAAIHQQWNVLYFLEKKYGLPPLNAPEAKEFIAACQLKESLIHSLGEKLNKNDQYIKNKILQAYEANHITFLKSFTHKSIEEVFNMFSLNENKREQMKNTLTALHTYIEMHNWESKSGITGQKYPGLISIHHKLTSNLPEDEENLSKIYSFIMGGKPTESSSPFFKIEIPDDYKIFLGKLTQSTSEEALKILEQATKEEALIKKIV